jgi:hypothetical protein
VLNALKAGFEACLIKEGTKSVFLEEGKAAVEEMKSAGAIIV